MRTEISKLSDGDMVQTIFFPNGVQACSLIPKGYKDSSPHIITSAKEVKEAGPSSLITYKELRQQVLDGHVVFAKNGKKIPCTQRAEKTPDKKVKVSITEVKGKIHYQIL